MFKELHIYKGHVCQVPRWVVTKVYDPLRLFSALDDYIHRFSVVFLFVCYRRRLYCDKHPSVASFRARQDPAWGPTQHEACMRGKFCSIFARLLLWWHFLIHLTVPQFHGWKEWKDPNYDRRNTWQVSIVLLWCHPSVHKTWQPVFAFFFFF